MLLIATCAAFGPVSRRPASVLSARSDGVPALFQAISFIVKSLGTKCVSYLSQVMPCLLLVIRTADAPFREFLFQQLATLIDVVRQHIRPSLPDIFVVIREFWQLDSPLQPTLITLVEHIAAALGSEFKTYMPQLIPNTLRVLYHDTSRGRVVTMKVRWTGRSGWDAGVVRWGRD